MTNGGRKILCAVDRDEYAYAVVRVAGALTRRLGDVLVAVHAIAPAAKVAGHHPHQPDPASLLIRRGRSFLEETAKDARLGAIRVLVSVGDPGPIVHEAARQWDPELVVCGSRGRGAIRSAVLGSVSRSLIRRCDRPLVIVPPAAAARWARVENEPEGASFDRIVCGIDGSLAGRHAALAAARIAARIGARVTLVHAYEPLPAPPLAALRHGSEAIEEVLAAERSSRWRVVRRLVELTGKFAQVDALIEPGDPPAALERVAEGRASGLIAVGFRRGGRLAAAMLGSASSQLLGSASRPVLVIPERDAIGPVRSDRKGPAPPRQIHAR